MNMTTADTLLAFYDAAVQQTHYDRDLEKARRMLKLQEARAQENRKTIDYLIQELASELTLDHAYLVENSADFLCRVDVYNQRVYIPYSVVRDVLIGELGFCPMDVYIYRDYDDYLVPGITLTTNAEDEVGMILRTSIPDLPTDYLSLVAEDKRVNQQIRDLRESLNTNQRESKLQ